ncbi:MAG: hypothetical protein U9P14_07360 [Gemmatimonadota bacterium]|nr:hypothetical protein [Gemmatimonadota bacterium]
MRKLFKKLLLLLPILIFMGVINYFSDPAGYFSKDDYSKQVADLLLAGHYVEYSIPFDRRLMQKHLIEELTSPIDIVVFGSSRSDAFTSSLFPGKTVFNHSVNRGTLQDYISIYELYRRKNIKPSTIILGLDPWILNENNEISVWQSLAEEYKSISTHLGLKASLKTHINNRRLLLENYYNLVSPGYFQKCIKVLFLGSAYLERPPPTPVDSVRFKKTGGWRPDGSYISIIKNSRTPEEVRSAAIEYANMKPVSFLGSFNRLDPETKESFETFMNYLQAEKIEVIFFLIPFHPVAYDILMKRKEYRIISEVEDYFRRLGQEKNIKVFGSYNPESAGVTGEDLIDGAHVRESGIRKILRINTGGMTGL